MCEDSDNDEGLKKTNINTTPAIALILTFPLTVRGGESEENDNLGH